VPGVKNVTFPSHLSKYSFGESHVMTPYIDYNFGSSRLLNSLGAVFSFKLVSPSRFMVSTKTIPDGLSALSNTISHGNSSSLTILISWPAYISLHRFSLNYPVGSNTSESLLLSSRSYRCLERSSYSSLNMVKTKTKAKVPIIEAGA